MEWGGPLSPSFREFLFSFTFCLRLNLYFFFADASYFSQRYPASSPLCRGNPVAFSFFFPLYPSRVLFSFPPFFDVGLSSHLMRRGPPHPTFSSSLPKFKLFPNPKVNRFKCLCCLTIIFTFPPFNPPLSKTGCLPYPVPDHKSWYLRSYQLSPCQQVFLCEWNT